ncbi:TPA: glycosyltransferase [Streptococcus suis]|nr:glycosyltransferase [Streptococcus suis]
MDKVSKIKYSIIIPIYKIDEQNLRIGLDSHIDGIPEQVEIILVDDNDYADVCGHVIDEYAEKYPFVKALHQVNQGVSVARNLGLANAKGEYIIFSDPDDWLHENFYQIVEEAISKNPNSDIILFAAFVNYKEKEVVNSFWKEAFTFRGKEKELLQLQLIAKGVTSYFPPEIGVGVPWARVYKKEFLDKHQLIFLPALRRMQDNIFNMYAFEYANEIVYIDEPIYHYRKNQESATNKRNPKVIYLFDLVNKEVESFIKQFNKPEIFSDALHIKRLIGVNSYYKLYFQFANSRSAKIENQREYQKLLSRNEYATSLKEVKYSYLLFKEKVFVSVLKTKCLSLLAFLQKLESILAKIKKRDF